MTLELCGRLPEPGLQAETEPVRLGRSLGTCPQHHSGMTSSVLSLAVGMEGDREKGVFEGKPLGHCDDCV